MTAAPKEIPLATIASCTPSEHQDVPFLTPAQFGASAGHDAIAQMRAMLGRSGPAARWDNLTPRQRAIVCYGAQLRPSTYASKRLDEMTPDEREAIRTTLVAMHQLVAEFGMGMLDRREFMFMTPAAAVEPDMERQKRETLNRAHLAQQARRLQALTTQ